MYFWFYFLNTSLEERSADSKHDLYYLLPNVCFRNMSSISIVGVSFSLDVIILVRIFSMLLNNFCTKCIPRRFDNFIYFKLGLRFVSKSLQNYVSYIYWCTTSNADVVIYNEFTLQRVKKRAIKSLQMSL